jgi:hypothetical protein
MHEGTTMIQDDVFKAVSTTPMSVVGIAAATGLSERQVRNALQVLVTQGKVRRLPLVRRYHGGRRRGYSVYAAASKRPKGSEHVGVLDLVGACERAFVGPGGPIRPMATERREPRPGMFRRVWYRITRALATPARIDP